MLGVAATYLGPASPNRAASAAASPRGSGAGRLHASRSPACQRHSASSPMKTGSALAQRELKCRPGGCVDRLRLAASSEAHSALTAATGARYCRSPTSR